MPGSECGKMKQAALPTLEVDQDGNPYVMHHKVVVIDDRYTVIGSFNFSDNAATDKEENMLAADDPAFARVYLAEAERVVARAKDAMRAR